MKSGLGYHPAHREHPWTPMISNERPSPYGRQPYGSHHYPDFKPKPRIAEDTLLQRELLVERKMFTLILKENPRGRFLRIIEDGGGSRRSVSIIVPATGLKDFQKLVADMVKSDGEIPPKLGSTPVA